MRQPSASGKIEWKAIMQWASLIEKEIVLSEISVLHLTFSTFKNIFCKTCCFHKCLWEFLLNIGHSNVPTGMRMGILWKFCHFQVYGMHSRNVQCFNCSNSIAHREFIRKQFKIVVVQIMGGRKTWFGHFASTALQVTFLGLFCWIDKLLPITSILFRCNTI